MRRRNLLPNPIHARAVALGDLAHDEDRLRPELHASRGREVAKAPDRDVGVLEIAEQVLKLRPSASPSASSSPGYSSERNSRAYRNRFDGDPQAMVRGRLGVLVDPLHRLSKRTMPALDEIRRRREPLRAFARRCAVRSMEPNLRTNRS